MKFKSGRIDVPGGLSVCTLKKHRNVIRQALQSTVRDGFLLKNPCDFLEMPQSTHREVNYYTKEELDTLLKAAEGKKIHDMIYLAALYGLRRSELCGLQWDSIDFKKKTVVIKHTMVKAGGLHMKDKTKNASSHRTYPLLDAVEEIFLR